jgi:TPR repeat protein
MGGSDCVRRACIIGAIAVAAPGCASGIFGGASSYDSQGCVEGALRRHPHSQVSHEALPLFEEGCAKGDAGACSALGVTYEMGIAEPPDPKRAAHAYIHACHLSNPRGCANWGAIVVSGKLGPPDYLLARKLFEQACDAGEASGCAALGRLHRDGQGVSADTTFARELLSRACEAGEMSGCFDLAGMLRATSPSTSLALYVRSCLAGEQAACDLMDVKKAPPAGTGGLPGVASR